MRIIAHRGNVNGPDAFGENTKEAVLKAIDHGFDVEIDLWCHKGDLYLGHDGGIEHVEPKFLMENRWFLWIHAKNLSAISILQSMKDVNFFYHDRDAYTLTSLGYLWAFPGYPANRWTICVDKDADMKHYDPNGVFGVCTDWPKLLKDKVYGK